MTMIQILDENRQHLCHVSPAVASRMLCNFEIIPTTDPEVSRFLTADERDKARAAHVRRITGLAHPHDKVSDDTIVEEFDAWVAEQGREVFV